MKHVFSASKAEEKRHSEVMLWTLSFNVTLFLVHMILY